MSVQGLPPSWKYFSAIRAGIAVTTQHCPEQPYVSLQIPSFQIPTTDQGRDASDQLPRKLQDLVVRRVVFTTVSHDQGFADNQDQHGGTYAHSNTWFEARLVMPSGQDRVLPRRRIQDNVLARWDFKTHVNTWDSSINGGYYGYSPSSHDSLSHWLTAICPGDTIQIVHKAHFPMWTNFVKEAKIEVWAAPSFEELTSPVYGLLVQNDYDAYCQLRKEQQEIRVIDLQPAENEAEPVKLVLRHTTLLESKKGNLKYDALSYCWSEANKDPHRLELTVKDDKEGDSQGKPPRRVWMHVSGTLLPALKRLRYNDHPRTLWIDQICINQIDREERASQVALMGSIFALADTVCVWLGENDREVDEDCRLIHAISSKYAAAALPGDGEALQGQGSPDLSPSTMHDAIVQRGDFSYHNHRIFLRSWFERVWVLQEVWNARRVQVFCGSNQLAWEEIMQADHCFKNHGLFATTISRIWNILFDVTREEGVLDCKPERGRREILKVLIAGHELRATDPRDKIFALLIFGEETHEIAKLPPEISPNYDKGATDVYVDFTRWWILHHGSLRILSAVHTLNGRTWVSLSAPYIAADSEHFDLSTRPSWSFWYRGFSKCFYGSLALHDNCKYHASGGRELDSNLIISTAAEKPHCLPLRGFRIGTISSLEPYPYYQLPPSSMDMYEAYVQIFDPNGIFGIWNSFQFKGSIDDKIDLQDMANKPREWRDHYIGHWGTTPPDGSENEQERSKPPWLPCSGQCMFRTDDGNIGLCPSGAEIGDIIVILNGGAVPYLLRHLGRGHERLDTEGFLFVGECFVDKIMNGEACPTASSEDSEVFLLV